MMDKRVIFESEEELRNILSEVYYEIYLKKSINTSKMDDAPKTMFLKDMSDAFKLLGYIRRNPVEEWENSMAEWNNAAWENSHYERHIEVIKIFENKLKIADDAVQYLKNQIVELNKKVGEI